MQPRDWTRLLAPFADPQATAVDILVPALRAVARGGARVQAVTPWTGRGAPPGRAERTQGPRLILHLAGPRTLHHGDGALPVEPGTVLILPEACAYGDQTSQRTVDLLIVARGAGVFAHVAERRPERTPEMRVLAWSADTGGRALESGLDFALGAGVPAEALAQRAFAVRGLAQLVLALIAHHPAQAVPAAGPPLVRRALWLIAERCADPAFDVAALAAAMGRHPSSLNRQLHAKTGAGTLAHLQQARLDRAERLLNDARLKIAEVARRSGFGTVRRLRIAWRQRHQRPPSVVRRYAHRAGP